MIGRLGNLAHPFYGIVNRFSMKVWVEVGIACWPVSVVESFSLKLHNCHLVFNLEVTFPRLRATGTYFSNIILL